MPVVERNTVIFPDNDWYQVQDPVTLFAPCEGRSSCTVPAGTYTVINLTSGRRFNNIVVPGAANLFPAPPDTTGYIFQRTDVDELRWVQGDAHIWIDAACAERLGATVRYGTWSELTALAPRWDAAVYPCSTAGSTAYVFARTDVSEFRWIDGSRNIWIDAACAAQLGGASRFGDWSVLNSLAPEFDQADNPCIAQPRVDTHTSFNEPLPEDSLYHNASGYNIVRDPDPGLIDQAAEGEAPPMFSLQPIEPTLYDSNNAAGGGNRAPGFTGLSHRTTTAGQLFEMTLLPVDADSGPNGPLPGIFVQRAPAGVEIRDNFDGTKTIIWLPLEPDVGVARLVVTAIDPIDSAYRAEYEVLINVVLPDNPGAVTNVRPMIYAAPDLFIRAGDTGVHYIAAGDANGTVPQLRAVDVPDGSQFQPIPGVPNVGVWRIQAGTAGQLTITVEAQDEKDASLTQRANVTVQVFPEQNLRTDGESLKSLAQARGRMIGFAGKQAIHHAPDITAYEALAGHEFNLITAENTMKMAYINPLPDRYRFADADNLYAFAESRGMAVHGHTLIWHASLPAWVVASDVPSRRAIMLDFINVMMSRYRGRTAIWDVVNEPVDDNGRLRQSLWFEAMGEQYIDIAFREARKVDPQAALILNEYDVAWSGPKWERFYQLVRRLVREGVPIDGVGFQMHVWSPFDQFQEVRDNFQKIADLGLDIYITEMDVRIPPEDDPANQARVYREITRVCLDQPACRAIQFWGLLDRHSWQRYLNPLLFSNDYQRKPAYYAVREALSR